MDFSLTEGQRRLQSRAREFAQAEVAPLARQMDEDGAMPRSLVERMAQLGLLGAPLPPEWGGQGCDALSLALIYEELGRADSSVRGFMTVHTSLVAQCILTWGSPAQKAECLPRLAGGDWIGCYCLTEPNAGSDVAGLETTARRDGDEYVLNGEKIWITNGGIADRAIVFATLDPDARHKGLCAFVVPTNTRGFMRLRMPGRALGHRASDHARLVFEECRVPRAARLGAEGEGFRVAMSALEHGRLSDVKLLNNYICLTNRPIPPILLQSHAKGHH